MWTVKEMLSLFIRYLSAFLFGICPPEPVYICLRATPHVLHLIIQRSPKSWPEAQSHLCEFLTICICDCLHNKRDRLHVCFIRKIWLAYGMPNICGFFLHNRNLRSRIFTLESAYICDKTVCKILLYKQCKAFFLHPIGKFGTIFLQNQFVMIVTNIKYDGSSHWWYDVSNIHRPKLGNNKSWRRSSVSKQEGSEGAHKLKIG